MRRVVVMTRLWRIRPVQISDRYMVEAATLLRWHRPVWRDHSRRMATYWPVWYAWAGRILEWILRECAFWWLEHMGERRRMEKDLTNCSASVRSKVALTCWWLERKVFDRPSHLTVTVKDLP